MDAYRVLLGLIAVAGHGLSCHAFMLSVPALTRPALCLRLSAPPGPSAQTGEQIFSANCAVCHVAITRKGNEWFSYNDAIVTQVTVTELLQTQAYILIYRRKDHVGGTGTHGPRNSTTILNSIIKKPKLSQNKQKGNRIIMLGDLNCAHQGCRWEYAQPLNKDIGTADNKLENFLQNTSGCFHTQQEPTWQGKECRAALDHVIT